jgi:hypothetical protein
MASSGWRDDYVSSTANNVAAEKPLKSPSVETREKKRLFRRNLSEVGLDTMIAGWLVRVSAQICARTEKGFQ